MCCDFCSVEWCYMFCKWVWHGQGEEHTETDSSRLEHGWWRRTHFLLWACYTHHHGAVSFWPVVSLNEYKYILWNTCLPSTVVQPVYTVSPLCYWPWLCLPNLDRFSEFFHCWKDDEISNKTYKNFHHVGVVRLCSIVFSALSMLQIRLLCANKNLELIYLLT